MKVNMSVRQESLKIRRNNPTIRKAKLERKLAEAVKTRKTFQKYLKNLPSPYPREVQETLGFLLRNEVAISDELHGFVIRKFAYIIQPSDLGLQYDNS